MRLATNDQRPHLSPQNISVLRRIEVRQSGIRQALYSGSLGRYSNSSFSRRLWAMLVLLVLILLIRQLDASGATLSSSSDVLTFLQRENHALSSAQGNVVGFLKSKGVRIGTTASERALPASKKEEGRVRIALSTEENNLECRVSLSRAALGAKVIAPCRCSGSQEWVQFSELNRLRRRDPQQWTVCPTCRAKFDFSIVYEHGGVQGNLISALLDKPVIVRSVVFVTLTAAAVALRVDLLVMRFLTSKMFWDFYPHWSKIVHLPLVLKYWGGKVAAGYLFQGYLVLEKALLEQLTDWETAVVEPALPVDNEEEGEEEEEEEEEEGDHKAYAVA